MSASKAPSREAASTGHVCSAQPANSADSGMQSPWKQGLQHVLAPAGQCFPDPSAQQTEKSSLGLNTCPTMRATAGQGAAGQDRLLPLFCTGLIHCLMLGKNKDARGAAPGERKGGANTCRHCFCCCGRDVLASERNLLYPHRKGKKSYNLKSASRVSCSFTSPLLTSFHPTAVTTFRDVGGRSEKQAEVISPLFSSLRLSLFLTPCLLPDVLTASLLPAFAFTLVFIQQFNSGS